MRPRRTALCLTLCATLLTGCGHRPSESAAPCVCPTIPDELLTCPDGAAKPDPIDMVTLTIALAEERAAGEVCRARMRELRGAVAGESDSSAGNR